MANGEQLLIETHGMVRELTGEVKTIKRDVHDAKVARKRIHERQDGMEDKYVTREDCSMISENIKTTIETTIRDTLNGKKRSRWLVVKDILIITLAPLATAIVGYIFYIISKGRFTP